MIILEPLGGLANRMRVIASGIWLKEKLQTELTVVWNENYELNCSYNLLFEDNGAFSILKKERKYNYIKTSTQTSLTKKISTYIVNKLIGIDYCIQESDLYKIVSKDIYEAVKKPKITYIQTCQEFGDNLFAFQYFTPVLSIIDKIDSVTNAFTPFTIGIHIRRTDNMNYIKYSPLDLFINEMKKELGTQKDTTFFLCTDDQEVEDTIITIFGEKVITYKKKISRQTSRGMQDAVVDLYCLSKTQKILGSYWSSFAEIASRFNNIELNVLKNLETNDNNATPLSKI